MITTRTEKLEQLLTEDCRKALAEIEIELDKVWCDKLYNASTHMVRQMILTVLDNDN